MGHKLKMSSSGFVGEPGLIWLVVILVILWLLYTAGVLLPRQHAFGTLGDGIAPLTDTRVEPVCRQVRRHVRA